MSLHIPIRKYFFSALILWTLTVAFSLYCSLQGLAEQRKNNLLAGGRAFFQQAVLTRAWNAGHGGVYVPVTDQTRPNKYLKIKKREIEDQDGVVYTKINPAYMTRQIAEIAERQQGVKFHITSLMPLRPENMAKPWEVKALLLFERGKPEYSTFNEDHTLLRYMAPLKVTQNCLTCHRAQGYKLGDIRGGISVTFPIPDSEDNHSIYIGHAAVYLVGLLGLLVGTFLLSESQKKVIASIRAELETVSENLPSEEHRDETI